MWRAFRERLSGLTPSRVTGPPTSSNSASSLHLFWDGPPRPLSEASATIEVIEAPRVERLYFWALQVSFQRADGATTGGAHVGLQHHPAYPGAGAVNWGGYRREGGEIEGSVSALPSTLDNVNTRDYRWAAGRRYRYRVHRSPERGWRATITDLAMGEDTVIRDLWIEGETLVSPMVWTEAFAHCDEPPAAVRWTDLTALTTEGEAVAVTTARVNYQSYADGGCGNSNASVDGDGFVQRTGVDRVTPAGSRLTIA